MKTAQILSTAFLGIGIIAAVCLAFVPQIIRQQSPGTTVKGPGYAEGAAIAVVAVMAILVLVSVVASLLAWLAGRRAGLSTAMLWSCWLPVPLAAIIAFLQLSKLFR